MEENNDIFPAGGDALVYLAVPKHKKYSTKFAWGRPFSKSYLKTNFSTPLLPCKHMYAFRVIVSAVGLFQKIILNTIGQMH